MAKLLHLSSSPRGDQSYTRRVAAAFLDAYRNAHSSDEVREIDLWAISVPPFDGAVLDAKYAIFGGLEHTPEQHAAWGAVEALATEFKSADKILISVPMWNFGSLRPQALHRRHYSAGFDVLLQSRDWICRIGNRSPVDCHSIERGYLFAWERRGRVRLLNRVS
jgi:hypothetical protein